METRNNVTKFVLLGLTQNPEVQKTLFAVFLVIYISTIMGNILIILTVIRSKSLRSPMYFFLAFLAFVDTLYSTVIVPKMTLDMLHERATISFQACMVQLFLEHLFAGAEICLLVFMAYDRYVAICKPLYYLVIMRWQVCVLIVVASWIGGFMHSIVQLLFIVSLPFCGPNVIDHFICDMYPLLKLSCTDTYIIGISVVANGGLMCTIFFLLLLLSYGVILHSLKRQSLESQQKALSTCTSHITVVVCFFIPCIFTYVRPVCTFSFDKFVSVFYTTITPMLNPLIYTLRNTEMKNAMRKLRKQILNK
ncbi:olfactory receptor 4A15-like isoform X1 [Vombatus ursinus]|uniref:olfactory receptor 4A15-like isoform X1 n=1 Tax=Vombatus ursinus TaxID=29139 RepID=UPI000FFD69C7|nr:olfactory receptor 4A15-like isoform X1 [Vombatus ursinus]